MWLTGSHHWFRKQATSHCWRQRWHSLATHICGTGGRWVKGVYKEWDNCIHIQTYRYIKFHWQASKDLLTGYKCPSTTRRQLGHQQPHVYIYIYIYDHEQLRSNRCYTVERLNRLNSSPSSAAYMRRWTGSALVQVMACQFDPSEQISVKIESKF